MIRLGRAIMICCLFGGVLVFAFAAQAQTRPSIAKQIADAHGVDSFEQIEAIRYTFHLEAPGHNLTRSWVWEPKTDRVSYEAGMQKLPLGKGSAEKVVVKYPSDGGYTPGDTWDLYIGPDKRVVQFAYHRGGSGQPKLITAKWEDYKKAGPLLISMSRPGKADHIIPSRVFFSDVAVKLAGSEKWLSAQ